MVAVRELTYDLLREEVEDGVGLSTESDEELICECVKS